MAEKGGKIEIPEEIVAITKGVSHKEIPTLTKNITSLIVNAVKPGKTRVGEIRLPTYNLSYSLGGAGNERKILDWLGIKVNTDTCEVSFANDTNQKGVKRRLALILGHIG